MEKNNHPFENETTEKTNTNASQSGISLEKEQTSQNASGNQSNTNGVPHMGSIPNQNSNPYRNGNPYMNGNPNNNGTPYMNGTPNTNGVPPMSQQPNFNYNGYNPNGGFQPKPTNGYAVASLVLGVIGLPLSLCYGIGGIIAGIIAIVLACISRDTNPDGTKGKLSGVAVGGLVTGIFSIVLGILIICLMVVAISYIDDGTWYSIEHSYGLLQTIISR